MKPILSFLLLTFLFSSFFYALIILSGHLGGASGLYVTGLMWCPGLAAFITIWLNKNTTNPINWSIGSTRFLSWSYLLPFLYALVTYLIIWISGLGGFYNHEFVENAISQIGIDRLPGSVSFLLFVLLTAVFGFIKGSISALGEEIGWRGFLAPAMYKQFGFTITSFVSGIIWAVWHYPILIFADYNNATPVWYGLACFTAMIIGLSFIFTWIRLKSGSIWTAVILHASHNLFIQRLFTPLTSNTGKTAWIMDEFGIGLAIITLILGIYFYTRRGELPQTTTENL